MKKFVCLAVFTFFAMSIFGQIPNVVVSDFTSRARDVHEDDLVTVMEMFMTTLVAGKSVNVIDRAVLKREMTAIEFGAGDWSDSVKTTRLGEELNAIYIVSGIITQLGTSITFDVIARDIKTLATIASDRKQYTTENVWDNSVGIPAQLSDIGNAISKGISTDYNKRQQEIKDQLAREEAERQRKLAQEEAEKKAELARQEAMRRAEEERLALVGIWITGEDRPPYFSSSGLQYDQSNKSHFRLEFRSNGTFSGTLYEYEYSSSGGYDVANTQKTTQYSGSYALNGNNLTITWTTNTFWLRRTSNDSRDTRNTKETSQTFSNSGSEIFPISFTRDNSGRINGLRGLFRKDWRR
jgi:hypothetical protein